MKFSLVGSFNLADGYLGAANALRNLGHIVDFIPAQKYKCENPEVHIDLIKKDIIEQNPDVVLWWRAESLTAKNMQFFRNEFKEKKFIMYSWDDPFQWEYHKDLSEKGFVPATT
jgi:hypothetical protein